MDQKGFTLIELIVIIVILGILAVTAVPKYVDLQSDARKATLGGLKGAIQGAYNMVHAKALIGGQDGATATGTVTLPGAVTVTTIFSYPGNASIDDALEDYSGFTLTAGTDGGAGAIFTLRANCTVTYDEPTAAHAIPTITIADSGC